MKKIHTMVHKFHNPELGILFVRIALGVVFIGEGWMKVSHMDFVSMMFSMMGIPVTLAYFVAYAEFIGGMLLIAGVFTRYIGIIFSIIMIVAIAKVHFVHGFSLQNGGYEYVFVLLFASMSLVTTGAGKYSIKMLLKKKN